MRTLPSYMKYGLGVRIYGILGVFYNLSNLISILD